MSKIIPVNDPDFELFDQELSGDEYRYFQKHLDAFKTMWIRQGEEERVKFVNQFYDFCKVHGMVHEFPSKASQCLMYFDDAKAFLEKNYARGKYSQAKQLIIDITVIAQNWELVQDADAPIGITPFYKTETRQQFRRFFGEPTDDRTYKNMVFSFPFYIKFGGAVVRGLKRVVDAGRTGSSGKPKASHHKDKTPLSDNSKAELDSDEFVPLCFDFKLPNLMESFCPNIEELQSDILEQPRDFFSSLPFNTAFQTVKFDLVSSDGDVFIDLVKQRSETRPQDKGKSKDSSDASDTEQKRASSVDRSFSFSFTSTDEETKTKKKKSPSRTKEKLHHCSFCFSVEPEARTYKKCGKCSGKGTRFYCDFYCQAKHWIERHHRDHS